MFEKNYILDLTTEIKASIITVNFLITRSLLKVQLSLTKLTGIGTQKMVKKPNLPNFRNA